MFTRSKIRESIDYKIVERSRGMLVHVLWMMVNLTRLPQMCMLVLSFRHQPVLNLGVVPCYLRAVIFLNEIYMLCKRSVSISRVTNIESRDIHQRYVCFESIYFLNRVTHASVKDAFIYSIDVYMCGEQVSLQCSRPYID